MMRNEPWDWPNEADNPHRRRRPLKGEILEPSPRVRIEVTHRYAPRPREHIPPWLIAVVILAVLLWISPFGLTVYRYDRGVRDVTSNRGDIARGIVGAG